MNEGRKEGRKEGTKTRKEDQEFKKAERISAPQWNRGVA
jgi:hypothetical protein